MAFVVHEDSVGALGPDAADEPLGVAVGLWCPRWDLDRLDALGGEHCIEGRAVFWRGTRLTDSGFRNIDNYQRRIMAHIAVTRPRLQAA